MADVKVVHNIAGYHELRSSPGVVADLESRGRRVLATAGSGYAIDSQRGANRWHVRVFTKTRRARVDNARRNTLIHGLDAARG